jgi:hypothetical protein
MQVVVLNVVFDVAAPVALGWPIWMGTLAPGVSVTPEMVA